MAFVLSPSKQERPFATNVPKLSPFDESKFGPMPDVELNPKDEFWVDPATLDSST